MKAKLGIFCALIMIASAVFVATPVVACHGQTVACDDVSTQSGGVTITPMSRTLMPGGSTEYHIIMTLSPGCGSTYYLYASLGTVPAGWVAKYTSGPGGTGTDYSNVDNVQCGQGNQVIINAYLNVTAPMQATEGQQAEIVVIIGADDNARNDKRLVTIKTTTKIHIPDPPVYVNSALVNFNMAEETEDATHINLAGVFKDTDNDPMTYRAKAAGNFTVSVFQDGKVTIKPKKDWNGMEVLVFICSDGITEASDDVAVTVTPVKDLPIVASPLKDFALPENGEDGNTINLNKVFFDADTPYGDKLTFSAAGQINITVTIKADGKVNLKPLAGWSGAETITFTAKDNAQNSITDDVKIIVTDSNRPPFVKTPINDFSIAEDSVDSTTVNLNNVFADSDLNTVMTYGYEGNSYINVSIAAGKVTFTPRPNWNGYEVISFWGTDSIFAPVYDDVRITVTPVNDVPYQKKDINITFDEDSTPAPVWLDTYFGDIDGDKLTYTATSSDELTIQISSKTSEISMTSKLNFNGDVPVALTVSDGKDQINANIPVKVRPVDDLPVILEWMPGGNALCIEGDEVSFSIKAIEFDGKPIQYIWGIDGNLTQLSQFKDQTTVKFKATKDLNCGAGTHDVKVFVSTLRADGQGWARADHCWVLTVKLGNRPPSIPDIRSPLAGSNFTTSNTIMFEANAEDLDGDPVSYTWYIDGVEKSKTQSFSMKLEKGTHKVKVTASDNKGASTESAEMNVTVSKPVVKPIDNKGLPGFEGLFLVAALGATLVLLRRKK